MVKQAMWVHGTSVQAEREGYHINRRRTAFGATFAGTGVQWFHFAIPTPVIFDGQFSTLEKAFALFSTTMTAKVTSVQLFDGKTKFKEYPNLNASGAHDSLDAVNTFVVVPQRHVHVALGISLQVEFGNTTPTGVPSITFVAAGADFLVPG